MIGRHIVASPVSRLHSPIPRHVAVQLRGVFDPTAGQWLAG